MAVAINWPAQFGEVGTDAGAEWASRGTALSAPVAPLVVLVFGTLMAAYAGRLRVIGVCLVCVLAVLFMVGGLGEAFAAATVDVPKQVLVGSGAIGVLSALAVLTIGVTDLRGSAQS